MENQVKSITRELNIFPDLMSRSQTTVWKELKLAHLCDGPCEVHTKDQDNVIIIRPDKTSIEYEAIRAKRAFVICPNCGWEICHR